MSKHAGVTVISSGDRRFTYPDADRWHIHDGGQLSVTRSGRSSSDRVLVATHREWSRVYRINGGEAPEGS